MFQELLQLFEDSAKVMAYLLEALLHLFFRLLLMSLIPLFTALNEALIDYHAQAQILTSYLIHPLKEVYTICLSCLIHLKEKERAVFLYSKN